MNLSSGAPVTCPPWPLSPKTVWEGWLQWTWDTPRSRGRRCRPLSALRGCCETRFGLLLWLSLLLSLDQGTALAAKPMETPLAVLTYAVGKVPGDAYLLLRSRRADLG